MKTLLDYATEEELTAHRAKVTAVRDAEAAVDNARALLREAEAAVIKAKNAEYETALAEARRAVGSDVIAPDPVYGPTVRQCELKVRALTQILADAQEDQRRAAGVARASAVSLLESCANRVAEDYVKAAKTLGWCWTQIAAVDMPLGNKIGVHHWNKLYVPGAEALAPMKTGCWQEWGFPVVVSGDRLSDGVDKASLSVKAKAIEQFGDWPL